ncbi:MAG: hypothetical protein U1E87_03495 [Alphaproteobacteria bacterium]
MLFKLETLLATRIMIGGWAVTPFGLALRYITLRAKASPPARRNPLAILFAVIQTVGLFSSLSGRVLLRP